MPYTHYEDLVSAGTRGWEEFLVDDVLEYLGQDDVIPDRAQRIDEVYRGRDPNCTLIDSKALW